MMNPGGGEEAGFVPSFPNISVFKHISICISEMMIRFPYSPISIVVQITSNRFGIDEMIFI